MTIEDLSPMIDLEFPLRGNRIPLDHGYLLYSAVSTVLDTVGERWFHQSERVGLHLIRGRYAGPNRLALTPHSALCIRASLQWLSKCLPLAGQWMRLHDDSIQAGMGRTRALVPASSVYARMVVTRNGQDEARFDAEIQRQLDSLGIGGRVIRGQRRSLTIKSRTIIGHSVLVTELTAQESICLQEQGLGGRRKMGCGLFLPWEG